MLLVPDTPLAPPSGQAGALRAQVAELEAENAGLREAATARDELAAAQLAARDGQIAALAGAAGQQHAATGPELRRRAAGCRLDHARPGQSRPTSASAPESSQAVSASVSRYARASNVATMMLGARWPRSIIASIP